MGSRLLYKSKTVHKDLNPKWDETFIVPIEDPFQPINIKVINVQSISFNIIVLYTLLYRSFIHWFLKVFDYDWGLQDDFMGSAKLSLTTFDLNQNKEVRLRLEDPSRQDKDLGELILIVVLWPKTQEDKEQVLLHCLLTS